MIEIDIVLKNSTIIVMNLKNKHKKVLEDIFHNPIKSGVICLEIEAMLTALGAEVSEGRGSRIRISLNGVRAVFHRPHPEKETDKGALKSMRRFLIEAGIKI